MASESGRSALLAKYGSRLAKAAAAHQHDEAKVVGYSELPAGINGGIAQVKKCYFDTYKTGDNKGEYFFYAAAVVVSPITFNGEQTVGKMTVLPIEPVCDTPNRTRKTLEEHISWIQNELKKMGCPTKLLSAENLEQAAEWIRKRKPHIRFRTWKGEKQKTGPYKDREPQVRHEWGGTIAYQESDETLAARSVTDSSDNGDDAEVDVEVVEGVEQEDTYQPTAHTESRDPSDRSSIAIGSIKGSDMTNTDPDGAESETVAISIAELDDSTIKDLIARANAEDPHAMDMLGKLAEKAGITSEQVDSATNWGQVYQMIETANKATTRKSDNSTTQEAVGYTSWQEGTEDSVQDEVHVEPEEEDEGIRVGAIYLMKLPDPKTGKIGKARQVEILSVNDQVNTVDVKVLGTTRRISKVAWKHLMPLE